MAFVDAFADGVGEFVNTDIHEHVIRVVYAFVVFETETHVFFIFRIAAVASEIVNIFGFRVDLDEVKFNTFNKRIMASFVGFQNPENAVNDEEDADDVK